MSDIRILLTSTSFQDTPGQHQELLKKTGYVVDTLRGPVKEDVLLPLISQYDGVICGDDEYTRKVIEEGSKGKLKILSKYGIGLDKIDLEAAKDLGIKVTNCPGVNHTTVAEHVFALLLSFVKHIPQELNHTSKGEWKRYTGNEVMGKRLVIFGMGKIGKEVAKRALAFGLDVYGYDKYWDEEFASDNGIKRLTDIDHEIGDMDIISLNMDLNPESKGLISMDRVKNTLKKGVIIINTARGGLVDEQAIIQGIEDAIIKGYLTDVLEEEPMSSDHPFRNYPQIFITPHIGSRTFESVERQGTMAVKNLLEGLV